jgi:hypothetical protein
MQRHDIIRRAIDEVCSFMEGPRQGLQDIFLSANRISLMGNMGLPIKNERKETLPAWRNPLLRGKSVSGVTISGYDAIPDLNPDVVFIAAPKQHLEDILRNITSRVGTSAEIAVIQQ